MVYRADDFYTSLGLPMMTAKFWKNSVFERESNVTKCHGTAANMFKEDDYRMIVCADRTLYDFYVIIHEMGHIHYYMASKSQPPAFQEGTNSAFQESIGDMIYLAMMTPQHLNRLRLIDDALLTPSSSDGQMNYFDYTLLLELALEKIPQIPFSLIIDEIRWKTFSGQMPLDDVNKYFWYLSEREQGIRPPDWLNRSNLFDPAAFFHFADNTPKIRYFLASFLQAQIFEGLCRVTVFETVKTKKELPMPLHRCDLYGSKKAGKLLK
jgi:peptidyl-dipeptidase A